jgi:hypothetical protein
MIYQHVGSGTRRPANVRLERRYELTQRVRAGDMICMTVGVDRDDMRQPQLGQETGIPSH